MEYRIGSMVLDGWKIVRRIGSGASGAVYEVQKQKDDITLSSALKVMKVPQDPSLPDTLRGDGMDEGSVTRYLQGVVDELIREIKNMVELKGFPYTVNCEDYEVLQDPEEEQWDVLIRMELLTPLQKYQQGRSLTEKDVYRMAVQLTEALCLFEDEKIIHRDIKPENIFLNKYGTCKIGDFGIARAYDRATGELSKKGTENYMAPEVYWGEDYGHTVDIYSLGLVLYKLMNKNRLPFYPLDREYTPSDRQRALAERMRGTRELEPPACASAQFGQIILKMCAYRPEDRYPDAKTLQQALEEYTPSNQVVLDDGRSIDGARTLAGGKTGVASTGQTQEDLDETNVMFGSSRSLRGLAKTDDGKIIAKSDGASVGDGNAASGKTSDSAEQTDEKSGPERTVGPEGIASDSTGLTNETHRSRLGHVEDIGGAEVTADSRTQTPEYESPRAAAAVRRDTGYDAAKTRQRLEELEIENRKQREKRRKICRFVLEGAAVLVILVAIISPLWKSRKFTLTIEGGSGSGSYKAGETVTVQAEVPEGSRFTGWTSDGVTLTAEEETDENLEITMPSKKVTLTAGSEEIVRYEVTVINQNGDGETVSAGTHESGETVTLQAEETIVDDNDRTCIFVGWEDVLGTLGDTDLSAGELSFEMPENDVEVQALYEQKKYTLTVEGGSGSGEYAPGETVTIRAKHEPEGWEGVFSTWRFEVGSLSGVDLCEEELTFEMPQFDVTLSALYEEVESKYTVTVIDENGIEIDGSGEYAPGETVTVEAESREGYTFSGWGLVSWKGTERDDISEKEYLTIIVAAADIVLKQDDFNLYDSQISFEMPDGDVSFRAYYEAEVQQEILTEAGEAYGEVGSYSISADGISGINYLQYKSQPLYEVYTGTPQLTKAGEISIPDGIECLGFIDHTYLLDVSRDDMHALMDLTGKQLTDFAYERFYLGTVATGWIPAKRADTEKYCVFSMSGEEVIPADYGDIEILSPYWAMAWDYQGSTVLYHMGENQINYIKIPDGSLSSYDVDTDEGYLNVRINSSEVVTFDAEFHVVAHPASTLHFDGLTEKDALKKKVKSLYGEEATIFSGSKYWGGGLDTGYELIESRDADGEYIRAVVDRDGNLIVPFDHWSIEDYSNGYFIAEKDEKLQFIRADDGSVTAEVEDRVEIIPRGIAVDYKADNGNSILVAADGTKTELQMTSSLGWAGKLWQNGVNTCADILDWHGNLLFENVSLPFEKASTDNKFLLIWKSEAEGILELYSVDGASVDAVVR